MEANKSKGHYKSSSLLYAPHLQVEAAMDSFASTAAQLADAEGQARDLLSENASLCDQLAVASASALRLEVDLRKQTAECERLASAHDSSAVSTLEAEMGEEALRTALQALEARCQQMEEQRE